MSNDLISRSELLEELKQIFLYEDEKVKFSDAKKTILTIPIAYDIDKVVEELYMHSVEEKIPSCLTHRIIDIEEAIEIVRKAGKINDKL